MQHAIIFDCEYLTAEGAMGRSWGGPFDPDPCVVQIGAVKLSLSDDFSITGTLRLFVKTLDRYGVPTTLDPFFTQLTGISQTQIDDEGHLFADALASFEEFCADHSIWSWGKDELNLLGISCYIAGINTTIAANRFGNACILLLEAGMPYADLRMTTSAQLADYYKLQGGARRHHDALDDAMSVALVLQHFLKAGRLTAADFADPRRI